MKRFRVSSLSCAKWTLRLRLGSVMWERAGQDPVHSTCLRLVSILGVAKDERAKGRGPQTSLGSDFSLPILSLAPPQLRS